MHLGATLEAAGVPPLDLQPARQLPGDPGVVLAGDVEDGELTPPLGRNGDPPVLVAAPYDLVVVARFGLGYFPPRQVQRIACALRTLMRPGAIWAIELQDLTSVANDHRDLNIRVRTATIGCRPPCLSFPTRTCWWSQASVACRRCCGRAAP
jgi:hypothetical protein